ncbi:MAG: MBL fold metallo-hydrolase [Planctomycetota bacterium]
MGTVTDAVRPLHPGAYLQCASWIVETSDGILLIDPGSGCEDTRLVANLDALGHAPGDVTHVLITHCHCDHAMGATFWQRAGAILVASQPCAAALAEAHRFIWGEHPELIRPITVDRPFDDGDAFTVGGLTVTALSTPGHTPGGATYLVDGPGERGAFTGDLLMHDGGPGWAGEGQYDPEALLQSLDRLAACGIRRAWPGHGQPIDEVAAWLQVGRDRGRSGDWHPTRAWQTMEVPPALRHPA